MTDPGQAERPAENAGSVGRASALLLGSQVISNIGYFVAVVLVARGLGPSGRGTLAFITVTALIVGRAVQLGVPEATTVFTAQRIGERPALLTNLVCLTLATGGVGAALACGTLVALGDARPAGVGGPEIAALAVGIVASGGVFAGNAFLLGSARVGRRAVVQAVMPWVYAALAAILTVAGGLTTQRVIVIWVLTQAVWAFVLFAASLHRIGFGRPTARVVRESTRFGLRAWAGSVTSYVNFRADQILMGFISTKATLGIYAVAVNGSEILMYLPQAAAAALMPAVARGRSDEGVARTLRVFRIVIAITLVSAILAALLGPLLYPIAFGDAFSGSVAPFLWLLIGAPGFAAGIVFSYALVGASAAGLSSVGPVASLAVTFALDVALIPHLGANGAAIAASAGYLTGGVVSLASYWWRTRFPLAALIPRPAEVSSLLSPRIALARRLLVRRVG